MANRKGRTPLPAGQRRIQIAARVSPDTFESLKIIKEETGDSLGRIIDDAIRVYLNPHGSTPESRFFILP